MGVFVLVRLAIPLTALAASGRDLPLFPRYDYDPLPGDAHAYYFAARELIAALAGTDPAWLAGGALGIAAAVGSAVQLVRSSRATVAVAAILPAVALSAATAGVVAQMRPTGATSIGWPLAWAVALLPVRAVEGAVGADPAFAAGFALSLLASAAAVVAVAVAGRRAATRTEVGVLAAGIFAFWPVLDRLVAGTAAWENATWHIETGLHLYSEPLSVALVTSSLAILLHPSPSPGTGAVAGLLGGLAVSTRVSNAVFLLVGLVWLARRGGLRPAAAFAAGAGALLPVVLAFEATSYAALIDDPVLFPETPFSPEYVTRTLEHFAYFSPRALAVLVPLAVVGAAVLLRPVRVLVVVWALAEPVFYSFYSFTWTTPRFVYSSLVAVMILGAAAIAELTVAGRSLVIAGADRRAPRQY